MLLGRVKRDLRRGGINLKETLNLKLKKPEYSDGVDIEIINTNMDKVDTEISNKSNVGHTHDDRYYTEEETNAKLSEKSDIDHKHDGRYSLNTHNHDDSYAANNHNHNSSYSALSHNHDGRYYTETEINSKLALKSDSNHTHGYELAFSKNTGFNKSKSDSVSSSNSDILATSKAVKTAYDKGVAALNSVNSHNHDGKYLKLAGNEAHFNNDDYLGWDDTANRFYTRKDGSGTKNYIYDTAHKPSKADVGLSVVNNWGATSSISDASNSKYATAGSVRNAYNKGVEALNVANSKATGGYGIGGVAKDISNQDLNNHINGGFYKGSNIANAPDANWFYIEVIQHASTWVLQIATRLHSDLRYFRRKENGVWRPWKKILNQDDFDQLFQSVSNGKNSVRTAITGVDDSISIPANPTFSQLSTAIGNISTGLSEEGVLYPKIFVQNTQPTATKKWDIWVKSSRAINHIYFSKNEPSRSNGNGWISLGNVDMQINALKALQFINESGSNITFDYENKTLTTPSADSLKIWENGYMSILAKIGSMRYWNSSKWVFTEAFYWDGSKWVLFSRGDYYLAVGHYNTVYLISPIGEVVWSQKSPYSSISDVSMGNDGKVYVLCNSTSDKHIVVYSSDGTKLYTSSAMSRFRGLFTDSDGYIYLNNYWYNYINKYSFSGSSTNIVLEYEMPNECRVDLLSDNFFVKTDYDYGDYDNGVPDKHTFTVYKYTDSSKQSWVKFCSYEKKGEASSSTYRKTDYSFEGVTSNTKYAFILLEGSYCSTYEEYRRVRYVLIKVDLSTGACSEKQISDIHTWTEGVKESRSQIDTIGFVCSKDSVYVFWNDNDNDCGRAVIKVKMSNMTYSTNTLSSMYFSSSYDIAIDRDSCIYLTGNKTKKYSPTYSLIWENVTGARETVIAPQYFPIQSHYRDW